eukprot:COSAG06_NODE_39287_length_414_cov_1.028571_1_plen_26_part_10
MDVLEELWAVDVVILCEMRASCRSPI